MSADSGIAPRLARRARNALLVEFLGYRTGAQTRDKIAKDGLDHCGLARIDVTAASVPRNKVIAVADASAGQALQNATLQTPPCLLGKVLEEEGIHGALQPDMELADLTLGQGDDHHL